uniref:Uncharacterized protein n=1 Tax=Sphaerodactylus townsendi TaxID=933632 RepID=A0ACB8ENQ7_9SAUR
MQIEQAEAELHRSQTVLQESWRLVSSTREQLLKQQEALTTEVQERRAVEEALNATLATACAGWCPEEAWLLHGGKCLFFSTQEKRWAESSADCEKRAAQLLAVTSKHPAEIPKPLESKVYWIGNNSTWTEEKSVHTPQRESRQAKCATLKKGKRAQDFCQKKRHYICEQPASPPAPVRLLRRLAGDPEGASPA